MSLWDGLRDALVSGERGLLGHLRRDSGGVELGDDRAASDRGASRAEPGNSRQSRSWFRSRSCKIDFDRAQELIFVQNYPDFDAPSPLPPRWTARRRDRYGMFSRITKGADAVFALDREIREKPQGGQSCRAVHAGDPRHDPDEGCERHSGARRLRRAFTSLELRINLVNLGLCCRFLFGFIFLALRELNQDMSRLDIPSESASVTFWLLVAVFSAKALTLMPAVNR